MCFCTIVTSDYIHYALSLNKSLLEFHEFPFYILVVDDEIKKEKHIKELYPNVSFLYLSNINQNDLSTKIIKKYKDLDSDALRWSLKPILLKYLIDFNEKVFFLDCDLYFFNDFLFLFDELVDNNIILTPHWRDSSPHKVNSNFDLLFVGGLFNAGFIGVNNKASGILEWWAICCEYKCEKNFNRGYYVDQTYLNLIPIYFDKVKILSHKGCNVAEWNFYECKRTIMPNGSVNINNRFPIIFIHFTNQLIENINKGDDFLLMMHFQTFNHSLLNFQHFSNYKEYIALEFKKYNTLNMHWNSFLYKLKKKIRIKRRIEKFLQG